MTLDAALAVTNAIDELVQLRVRLAEATDGEERRDLWTSIELRRNDLYVALQERS